MADFGRKPMSSEREEREEREERLESTAEFDGKWLP